MTIPSRPAPPPPQQQSLPRENTNRSQISTKFPGSFLSTQSRYSKITSTAPGTSFTRSSSKRYESIRSIAGGSDVLQENNGTGARYKKVPPPRPPPPKVIASALSSEPVLKKSGPPQSVNVLSNFFGRKRSSVVKKQPPLKLSQPPLALAIKNQQLNSSCRPQDGEMQLISFDSPPSSPTLTQKSNSDCVSVDSFSSDSNFSSPNNGSTSQPESGFEDDFASPPDPWEAIVNDPFRDANQHQVNTDLRVTQPVRNLHAINKIQNDNVLCNGKSLLPPVPTLTMPTIIKPRTTVQPQTTRISSPVCSVFGKGMCASSNGSIKRIFDDPTDLDDSLPSPPMPSCPPPPPPPLVQSSNVLGVITRKLDAIYLGEDDELQGPSYGIALYDFHGVEDEDLSFRENEKIYLLQRLNEEWYLGRNRKGCEGIFPANYIQVKVPLKDALKPSENPQNAQNGAKAVNSHKFNKKVRALYKFTPEVPEDLAFNVNDMVTVLHRINSDWLYGEVEGRCGQFPANFIEYIPENLSQIESK